MFNLLSRLYFTHMGADGGANSLPLLEDEPIHQCMERSVRTWRMPNWFRPYYFSGSSNGMQCALSYFHLSYLLSSRNLAFFDTSVQNESASRRVNMSALPSASHVMKVQPKFSISNPIYLGCTTTTCLPTAGPTPPLSWTASPSTSRSRPT